MFFLSTMYFSFERWLTAIAYLSNLCAQIHTDEINKEKKDTKLIHVHMNTQNESCLWTLKQYKQTIQATMKGNRTLLKPSWYYILIEE